MPSARPPLLRVQFKAFGGLREEYSMPGLGCLLERLRVLRLLCVGPAESIKVPRRTFTRQ